MTISDDFEKNSLSSEKLAHVLARTSFLDVINILALSLVVILFVIFSVDATNFILSNCFFSILFFVAGISFVVILWLCLLFQHRASTLALLNSRIALTPVYLLVLIFPYHFSFFGQFNRSYAIGALVVALWGVFQVSSLLREKRVEDEEYSQSLRNKITLTIISYGFFFIAMSIFQYVNYQTVSSFDLAIANQIQWNNIRGNFLESSISGSNFVTHNSPFLAFLSPLYAIFPYPVTLLVIKNLFLALSAIPFYLILKEMVGARAILPLILSYLFYPFIVGQNFNAPHEACFLPLFLLFSYYFFMKEKFIRFLIFLFLCLSIKEHIALLAVAYGLLAAFLKKDRKWVIVPILIGLAWAVFSFWVIVAFQKIYHVDPKPAWLIENIKSRFTLGNSLWECVWSGLKTSNLGHWDTFNFVYVLFSPLFLVLPFFSSIFLMGLPELMINFLANFQLMTPLSHYNLIVSFFLLIACVKSIQKISQTSLIQKLNIGNAQKTQTLLAWILCINILCHFFLWLPYTMIHVNENYVRSMNQAIAHIPQDASVSAPRHLAAYVSSRRDYFLLEDARIGDFILTDRYKELQDELKAKADLIYYQEIFREDEICLLKRKK